MLGNQRRIVGTLGGQLRKVQVTKGGGQHERVICG
jgi:hypothetical protein